MPNMAPLVFLCFIDGGLRHLQLVRGNWPLQSEQILWITGRSDSAGVGVWVHESRLGYLGTFW